MHIFAKCGMLNKGIARRRKKQTAAAIAVHFIVLLYNPSIIKKYAVNQILISTFTPCSL